MKEEEEWLLGFFAKNIRKISPEHSRFFFPLPHRGAVWRKWMLLQKPLTVFRTANRLKRESRIAARSAICILSLSNNRGSINPPTFLLLPLWTFYNCSSGFFWRLDDSDSDDSVCLSVWFLGWNSWFQSTILVFCLIFGDVFSAGYPVFDQILKVNKSNLCHHIVNIWFANLGSEYTIFREKDPINHSKYGALWLKDPSFCDSSHLQFLLSPGSHFVALFETVARGQKKESARVSHPHSRDMALVSRPWNAVIPMSCLRWGYREKGPGIDLSGALHVQVITLFEQHCKTITIVWWDKITYSICCLPRKKLNAITW